MFRDMRRINQSLSKEMCQEILNNHTAGVLALIGDDDYPYPVPLSYVYDDGKIYFHCAKKGHKIDAIRNHQKASFCVIDKDEIIAQEFTTYYRSVIAFGKIEMMEDSKEIYRAIKKLANKYSPGEDSEKEIAGFESTLCMLCLNIEHLSGKEAKELMLERKKESVNIF